MSRPENATADRRAAARRTPLGQAAQASRVPTPRACGCGLPVAFDLDKHEFFCIGCGASKLCLCRHSPFSSGQHPVQVA